MWSAISAKIGKKPTFIIASLVAVVSFVGVYFIGQFPIEDYADMMKGMANMPAFGWVFIVLMGIGIGGVQLMPFTMIPDAINFSLDADDKSEGAFYGIVTLAQKVGTVLATLLIGPILTGIGYKTPPPNYDPLVQGIFEQSTEVAQGIRDLFIFLSLAIILLGAVAMIRYKVDKKALSEKLQLREDANTDAGNAEVAVDVVQWEDVELQ
jgi:Na+/melibiose symporter-like transporter